MEPQITTYIQLPDHPQRAIPKPNQVYAAGPSSRPCIVVPEGGNRSRSLGMIMGDNLGNRLIPSSSMSRGSLALGNAIHTTGKFSTYPPRSMMKSWRYSNGTIDTAGRRPVRARSSSTRPLLTRTGLNSTPQIFGDGLGQGFPVNWISNDLEVQHDPGSNWTSALPAPPTSSQPNPIYLPNPLINDYPLPFLPDQTWSTHPPTIEMNDQGIQSIPMVELGLEEGMRPLTTHKPLLFRKPTWRLVDEEMSEKGQKVLRTTEEQVVSDLSGFVDEGKLQYPQYVDSSVGSGLGNIDLDASFTARLNTFIDEGNSNLNLEPTGSHIDDGGIVPLESAQPKGPLQFKMPCALTAALGGIGGFQMDNFGVGGNASDGGSGKADVFGCQAGQVGVQCPPHWGGEKGGVMGWFRSPQKEMTGLGMPTDVNDAGVLGDTSYAYAFQSQARVPTRRHSIRSNTGTHYQHGPIVSIPNSSSRYRPYVKKSKPVATEKYYAAPVSFPMTPPESSCFKNASLAMREETDNITMQEEAEMMRYQMDQAFEIPVANDLLGRNDSWTGGDIFELIDGTVPPVVATMTGSADTPSSPVEVPLRPREQTGVIFLPELPAIPRRCASPISDEKTPRATASSAPQPSSVLSRSPKAFMRSLTTVGDVIKTARLEALQAPFTDGLSNGLFTFSPAGILDTYDAGQMGWSSTFEPLSQGNSTALEETSLEPLPMESPADAITPVSVTRSDAIGTEESDSEETQPAIQTETTVSFRLPAHETDIMRTELKHLKGWNGNELSKEDDKKVRAMWLDAADRRNWHLQHRYAVPMLQNTHTIFLPPAAQCRCCARTTAPLLPGASDDPPLLKRKWPCLVAFEIPDGQLAATSKGCCLSCALRKASCSLVKTPVTGITVIDGMPSLPTVAAAIKRKGPQRQKADKQTIKTIAAASTMKTRSSGQTSID